MTASTISPAGPADPTGPNGPTGPAGPAPTDAHQPGGRLSLLMLGAIGVVYGDIGTSPLYAMKESFVGPHPMDVEPLHIFGVISLIFWSLMLVVTVKYVWIAMRADNHGEGGSFALLSLIQRSLGGRRWTAPMIVLGVLAACLFYGDAMITPAISVLSAVEGLAIVEARMAPMIIPISIALIVGLFLMQARGTARVGLIFGPIMLLYFAVISALGITNIVGRPEILGALSPHWAVKFFAADPKIAFLAMGSVFLAMTGAEALYADMGHFGRRAINWSWLSLVYPALALCYLGQGALLLETPTAVSSPFYLMAPDWARLPLVVIATMAAVIASQSVITGAFSVTHQAVQLGFLPRLKTTHTSGTAQGQIYMPLVNWGLLVMVIVLILGFQKSSNLASAFGIAVTGTMIITTIMLGVLVFKVWKWNRWKAGALIGLFLAIDGIYFASNITKVADGGWFPLVVAGVGFVLLTTWATGRRLMREHAAEMRVPLDVLIKSAAPSTHRVRGTAVFLASTADAIPSALLHNLKHNQVLHDRVIILTVKVEQVPEVDSALRIETSDQGQGFYRVILHYGFMEEVVIARDLALITTCGTPFSMMNTSFFLGRQKIIAGPRPGMAIWRERLFAWMLKSSESPMEFFGLPPNRVVELGSQVQL